MSKLYYLRNILLSYFVIYISDAGIWKKNLYGYLQRYKGKVLFGI